MLPVVVGQGLSHSNMHQKTGKVTADGAGGRRQATEAKGGDLFTRCCYDQNADWALGLSPKEEDRTYRPNQPSHLGVKSPGAGISHAGINAGAGYAQWQQGMQ